MASGRTGRALCVGALIGFAVAFVARVELAKHKAARSSH
jgi:hypothetical protein